MHFLKGLVVELILRGLVLEDLVECLDGVLLIRREGLVFEDGVVVPVELVKVLQVDEFVELLARLLVHADVGVVIFVEGLQHGRQ